MMRWNRVRGPHRGRRAKQAWQRSARAGLCTAAAYGCSASSTCGGICGLMSASAADPEELQQGQAKDVCQTEQISGCESAPLLVGLQSGRAAPSQRQDRAPSQRRATPRGAARCRVRDPVRL